MSRKVLLVVAAFLLTVAVSVLLWQLGSSATTLRVAVGPPGSEDARLIGALAVAAARDRETVRLQAVPVKGPSDAARALEDGRADLAVVRTDIAMPDNAQTVAIMHRNAVVLVTPQGSGIRSVADLKDRTVGITGAIEANRRLLERLLSFYEVSRDSIRVVALSGPGEVENALRAGHVDVLLAVGTLGGRTVTETYAAALSAAGGGTPGLVPVLEAEAIAQRSSIFEPYEIVRGAFGGASPRPAETVRTIGVSHRLMAATTLPENVVAELARIIFALRPRVAADVPLANRIEAPDTAKDSSLPVHAGAAAYFDGEVQSFFDRYSDWIYVSVMVLSLAGSVFAGFASSVSGKREARTLGNLGRLSELLIEARRAETAAHLDRIEREADEILAMALGRAGARALDQAAVAAFALGLGQVRAALEARRAALAA